MILIMSDNKKKVKQARKIGGSLMMSLTGYVKEDRFYKIEKLSDKEITISQIEV